VEHTFFIYISAQPCDVRTPCNDSVTSQQVKIVNAIIIMTQNENGMFDFTLHHPVQVWYRPFSSKYNINSDNKLRLDNSWPVGQPCNHPSGEVLVDKVGE